MLCCQNYFSILLARKVRWLEYILIIIIIIGQINYFLGLNEEGNHYLNNFLRFFPLTLQYWKIMFRIIISKCLKVSQEV